MSKGCMRSLAIGGALILLMVIVSSWVIGKYNHLVQLDEEAKAQWGNVQNAYQKRYDLVDNLVKTVQGAADFERGTLTEVIAQRNSAAKVTIDANNLSQAQIDQFQQAQSGLSGALSRLNFVVERYPDLKANQNFLNLQSSLESIEDEIKHERNKFNDRAKAFNQYRNQAINSIVASFFPKFAEKGYFKADAGADQAPDVNFDFNNSEGN